MTGYRMEMASAEEMAADDPFGGNGAFLPMKAASEDILDALIRVFDGTVQAITWPGRGAWIDTSAMNISVPDAVSRWESAHGG